MATVRKRGNRWQVQVRRQGHDPISRSFLLREDALAWARHAEIAADRREVCGNHPDIKDKTLADMLHKYLAEVMPRKRSSANETICINAFLRTDLARKKLLQLSSADFGAYRDERLTEIRPATFNREIGIIRHAFEIAMREWGWPIKENPIKKMTRPKNDRGRDRRLSAEEVNTLMIALEKCLNPYIKPLVLFAIETGMRRGEMLNACWKDLGADRRTLHIPHTKNGQPRTIPLSTKARVILSGLEVESGRRIFPITIDSIRMAWPRLIKRAGIKDLHFHDLRHEAVSRFFELGLSVPEVALISGHRDYRMLFRYTHLKPENLVEKLK